MVSRKLHRILVILLTISILHMSVAPMLIEPAIYAANADAASAAPLRQQNTIAITDTGFSPAQLTITEGETVTWVNQTQTARVLNDGEPPVNGCPDSGGSIFLPLVKNQQGGVSGATNEGTDEQVAQNTASAPADFSETLDPGESFAFLYATAGTYRFYVNPDCTIVGTITVQATSVGLLGPVGDQTAPLGSTLTIQLRSDRASAVFDIAPLPLPEHASFDAANGLFHFQPSPDQIGSLTLTFSASDNGENESETITITVPEPDPNGATALRGRILDANDAERGIETPLIGATVKHIGSGRSVTTGNDGYFELSGLQPGENYIEFNGITAQPAGTYGAYRAQKELIANVTNVIDRPIYIMAIDMAGQTQVVPDNTTIVTNPNLNATITIPAHTVMNDADEEYSGPISVSEVPDEFTPGSLPDTLDPGLVMTIQPMGLTFNQPAPISFPNFDNLPAGSEVDLWSMDHETAQFFIAGKGRVTSDRTMIETFEGGIRESSWHFPLPAAPDSLPAPDNNDAND
ncbi:MAG: hypothetical protein KDK27_17705, partial [Leptospiraceae bacterium]|nr:hypothetical protein [Leptospiraceae bacterium]